MTYTVPAVDDHAVAIVALLATTGIDVDRGVKPAGAGWQGTPGGSVFVPYMMVDLHSGSTTGPAADPVADADIPFDVRCVGATPSQAEQVADVARQVLCTGRNLAVPGRALLRPIALEVLAPARADLSLGDGQTLFLSSPRFRLRTVPAPEAS